LTRTQITEHLQRHNPDLPRPNWDGAPHVSVSRATRLLRESELLEMLTSQLSEKWVKGNGELELRLNRTWNPVRVPDEPLTLEVYDLPATGLNSYLILRFDLADPRERIGTWQVATQAKLWRKIPVAESSLRRGQLLRESDCTLERRDVLATREALDPEDLNQPGLELVQNIDPGMPILSRSVRIRPLVQRGHVVEAVVQNGLLNISMKVQVLEDGRPGQLIRVRNLKSRREFYGKVQDENTVLVPL
jgi:flagella basal body P-ring formation protein FlgA